jgi:hypothetical protein
MLYLFSRLSWNSLFIRYFWRHKVKSLRIFSLFFKIYLS